MRTIPAPKQSGRQLTATKASSPIAIRAVGQTIEQSNNINEAVDRLERVSAALRERLSCITADRPVDPSPPNAPDSCLVALADQLRTHQRRINNLVSNLEELIEAIEL